MQPPARELKILLAVAKGDSHARIARQFDITEGGVKASLVKTRERYGAVNTEEAIACALAARHISWRREQYSGEPFTQAEVDFLALVAGGNEDDELMRIYFSSRKPIDNFMKVILEKLGAANRCNAVYKGFRYGILAEKGTRYYAKRLRNSEADALIAVANSASIEEAAAMLFVEPVTVKTHLQHCRRRLNADSTPQAIAVAIHNGELFCPPTDDDSTKQLDWRERGALLKIALGLTDPEVAEVLKVSVRTLTRIVASALTKIGAKSRANAIFILFQQGVLK